MIIITLRDVFMLNSPSTSVRPVNNFKLKTKEQLLEFSTDEKKEIINSLEFLGLIFENFVVSFYKNFLAEQTLKFIKNNSKENLINMLTTSLNIIVSSIEHPIPLEEYVQILDLKYPYFSDLIKKPDLFTQAFMFAIIDTYKENYTDRLGELWYRIAFKFVTEMYLFFSNPTS